MFRFATQIPTPGFVKSASNIQLLPVKEMTYECDIDTLSTGAHMAHLHLIFAYERYGQKYE